MIDSLDFKQKEEDGVVFFQAEGTNHSVDWIIDFIVKSHILTDILGSEIEVRTITLVFMGCHKFEFSQLSAVIANQLRQIYSKFQCFHILIRAALVYHLVS